MSHHCSGSKGCCGGKCEQSGSGCGCGAKNCQCGSSCGCGSSSCGCGSSCCQSSCHGDFSKELLHMADCAWMELLKQKIKQRIEDADGPHLDKLADIVSSCNHERWSNKMKKKDLCECFENKLRDFHRECSSCKK